MQTQEREEVETTPTTSPGRRILGIVIALAVIGALVFVKYRYFPAPDAGGKGGKGGGKAAGSKAGGRTPVQVYPVAATSLSNVVATTGSVLADESVVIQSEISGKITSLNIKEGQPVKKGQLLFTINADEIQANLKRQAFNLKLYQDQEQRQRTLLEKEYISAQEYEQTNNLLLTARADEQALRAALAKAYVRAPFSGVLGLTTATVGTYVSPGTQITTLSRIRPVKVDFAVPSRFSNAVKVGDPVTVTDEATTKKYQAKVYAINPQIDPVSRTLQVRALYSNAKDELRPGAFVKVNLQLGATTEALQIPTEAVIPDASGYTVYVVKNGKAESRKVKIGNRSDKLIEITDGLAVGDSLIRTGILQVKAGDKVAVQK
ncbi:efflux RND transporter periplasmic adaptor subunit [Hymenobacter aerilatus]|uniref:Efflux RND transporter periplasmic adaptor subunit n=1 Tax=Hymenobacter aerilatus TaxID=2932251 RepID=A0A8T9SRB1_9BACT|nr:efflux RND transporter periplasmic adaptor subunit [Hymenobacter aerilatus]UOR03891.1 efflux RND transporter periplasmic adaptor subunit [Hymenobacter aerilatus]